jgi:hypothetical protein
MKIFIGIGLFCLSNMATAQTVISGRVKDEKGNALPFASVYLDKSISGTITDTSGKYSFSVSEKGKQLLVASCIGYQTSRDSISLNGKAIVHNVVLKENSVAVQEVVITAGAFEANNDKDVSVLKPLDIYTNAGAGGDIMGAFRTLPGNQAQSEQTGLFVRGGDASESSVIIDGMVVQNPFTSNVPGVSQRSRFTPFQFQGMSFSSGGYSARYGQALSSILELNTFDLPESSNLNLSAGMTGLAASGTKKWISSAIEFSAHYDNTGPFLHLAKSNFQYSKAPEGGGSSIKYTHSGSHKDLLKCFVKYDGYSSGIDIPNPYTPGTFIPYGLSNKNLYSNISYSRLINKISIHTQFSGSTNSDEIKWNTLPATNKDWRLQWRGEVVYYVNEKLKILMGTEIQRYKFSQTYDTLQLNYNELITAGYIESEWKPIKWFALKAGLRYENSILLDKNNLAPRLALAVGTGVYSQISLATGMFYENPDKKYLLEGFRPNFQEANHYIINFQRIKNDRTFRVEAYYKSYNQLVRELTNQFDPNSYRYINPNALINNSGNGYAQGIEFFWRDKASIHNFDYWFSYSYIDTKRLYENYLAKASPTFIADNNLNILAKYFIEVLQLNVGLSYTYASGRPYYNPQSAFLSDRTPEYRNLSANMSYLMTIGKYFAVAYISVDNIPGRKNIFGYRYSPDGSQRYPVLPALDRWVYAGFTISLSKFNKDEL